MSKTSKKTDGKQFSVDRLMLNLAKAMVRDFQSLTDEPGRYNTLLKALKGGNVPEIRKALPTPNIYDTDSYAFKCDYQLQDLFKRYRFSKDTYSDDELLTKARVSFEATQSRLRTVDLDRTPWMVNAVLDSAAVYISRVLGQYQRAEHVTACGFGTGATVGVPSRLACEGERWELPLTGTENEVAWFSDAISEDTLVQDYFARQMVEKADRLDSPYQVVDALPLTLVPKSYKSMRSIVPCTTIGSYISRGLGKMLERRLKRIGLDVSTLQNRHNDLAREASTSNQLATVDLSAASDSISHLLMKRLFPQDWYQALCLCQYKEVVFPDENVVELQTFSLMGNGYTFPLQTLVFYALLRSIDRFWMPRDRCPGRRVISVYGDDMIFDRDMFVYMKLTFSALGFVVNDDKSFSDGYFRESCGGDYHSGVDVRPFQPKNDQSFMEKVPFESYLYKMINGLLRRWSEYEVAKALKVLISELHGVVHKCKIVPPYYSDISGVKVPSHDVQKLPNFLREIEVCKPVSLGHGTYRFPCLGFTPDRRKEERHEPYCWLATSSSRPGPDTWVSKDENEWDMRGERTGQARIRMTFAPESLLRNEFSSDRLYGPKGKTGFVVRIKTYLGYTSVVVRNRGRLRRQLGVTSHWTP